MARIQYPASSPYSATPQASWYIGYYVNRRLPPDPTDEPLILSAKYNERPDLLSNDLYGTPVWYWVFWVRNRNLMKDPLLDMKAGIQIMVPTLERVQKVFGS